MKKAGKKKRNCVSRRELEDHLITRAWEDEAFRKKLLKDPRATVEKELCALSGRPVRLEARVRIQIHEEEDNVLHFILPARRDAFACRETDLVVFWQNALQA